MFIMTATVFFFGHATSSAGLILIGEELYTYFFTHAKMHIIGKAGAGQEVAEGEQGKKEFFHEVKLINSPKILAIILEV